MQPFDATSAYRENYPAHEPQPRWRHQQEVYKGESQRHYVALLDTANDHCHKEHLFVFESLFTNRSLMAQRLQAAVIAEQGLDFVSRWPTEQF